MIFFKGAKVARRMRTNRDVASPDFTMPGLKGAWQQGRKELFYPYGKTYAQTIGEQD